MARRGSVSGGTRRGGSSGSGRRSYPSSGGGGKEKKDDRADWLLPNPFSGDFRGSILDVFNPWGYLGERTGTRGGRVAGNILGTLGTSPAALALYPESTYKNTKQSLWGAIEAPYATYKSIQQVGLKDTASMMKDSLVADYKDRYGDDWKDHARDNPLFNFFDLLTLVAPATRAAAMSGAAARLGAAGEKATLRNLWRESSRPGLISTRERGPDGEIVKEGEPFSRVVSYQPETGPLQTSVQPWSRSPLRRGTQEIGNTVAERFPDIPVFGARARVSRSGASTLRRTMERTLGAVIGEEALNSRKLGEAGRTRLFWESQLGTTDDATLRLLRDRLADEYDADLTGVDDPGFRDWLHEAKQAGFGKELVKRLDAAIEYKTEGNKRYERARDALRQMTQVAEDTIVDADGFTELRTDLYRVDTLLKKLDHGSKEGQAAIAERIRLTKALADKTKQLEAMFGNRRNILRDWLGLAEGQIPDIFIPHRSGAIDLKGVTSSRGIPRATREIGDRLMNSQSLFNKNQLALLRAGLLNDDPRALAQHLNRIVALARANQLREFVLEMAEPLPPGTMPDFDKQYVVKKAGTSVDKPTFDALERAESPEDVRKTIQNYIDDNMGGEDKFREWEGKHKIYVVDKKLVDMLFKNVTGKTPGAATKPKTNTGAVIDAGLDTIRGALLYANPGFYMTNVIGNFAMGSLADPRFAKHLGWSMKQATTAAARPEAAGRTWQRIAVEMGRGPMSATMSTLRDVLTPEPGSPTNKVGKAAEWWSEKLGTFGRRSGRVIDDTFRVAAWRQAAAKRGYKTEAQIEALFDDPSIKRPFQRGKPGEPAKGKAMKTQTKAERDLAEIRDEAEQLMFDFDSMTPTEKTWLQRMIFLYPFIKASAKYPFIFTGERPLTAAAAVGLTGQGEKFAEDVLGERPEMPEWLSGYARGPGGYYNVGSFSPFGTPGDLLQTALNIRGPAPIGVERPIDYSNPGVQLLLNLLQQRSGYGRDAKAEQILRDEVPLPGWARYPLRKPSEQYADRDFWNTFLRSLRVAPTELTAGMGEPTQAPSTGGGRRRGGGGSRRRGYG